MEQPYTGNVGESDLGVNDGFESGEGAREVHVSDLIETKPTANAETKPAGTEGSPQAQTRNGGAQTAPGQDIKTQVDFNRVLGSRLTQERDKVGREFRATPQYSLGDELIRERMVRDGVSAEEAHRRIRAERADRLAEEAVKDPRKFYRDAYSGGLTQPPPQQPIPQQQQEQPLPQQSQSVGAEIMSYVNSGQIPAGFSPEQLTKEFVAYAQVYGVQEAFDNWSSKRAGQPPQPAQQQPAQQQRPAQAPMRVTGGDATRKPVDFTREAMSDADFDKLLEKMESASARGDKVRL